MLLKNIVFPLLILGAGVFAMFTLQNGEAEEKPKAKPAPTRMVAVKAVALEEVAVTVEAFGRVVSQQPTTLISEVEGRLSSGNVDFLPESRFKKDQVMLRIDDRPTRLQIKRQKSALLNALARALPEIRIEYPDLYPSWQTYFDQLGFEGELPEMPQAQNNKIKLFLSRFEVYNLYFQIRDLEIQLDKHIIRAPFDGIIRQIYLRPGATVRPGSVIADLLNMDQLEVAVEVPADLRGWIDPAQAVTLHLPEMEQPWQGQITRLGNTLDAETQTLKVYVKLNTDPAMALDLYEGMFLQAKLHGKKVANAVEIPLRLLYGKDQVFLVKDGKLEARKVEVAYRLTNTAIITGGLNTGDQMVWEVLQGAVDGMPVDVKAEQEQS